MKIQSFFYTNYKIKRKKIKFGLLSQEWQMNQINKQYNKIRELNKILNILVLLIIQIRIQYSNQMINQFILTKISQELERNLNDTSKQFNSKLVLNTIEQQIENFKSNPDRSIKTTWHIRESIDKQSREQKEFKEIEYQIQEFLDQGLSDEDVKNNITLFVNQYFNNSQNLQGDLNDLDQLIKEISHNEKQKNSTQTYKNIRQEIREIIRESLRDGKSEEEITDIIQDFLNQNGYKDLNDNQKQEIQQLIQKEIIRFKRQQDYKNNVSKDSTSQNKSENNNPIDTTSNNESNEYNNLFYIGGICSIVLVFIILFVIRRQRMKKNQSKRIGFKIQESSQEVEQIE